MNKIDQGNIILDRMDEVVITWINGSTSPADQLPQPSNQGHHERP
jgi:hypothetical protein